MEVYLSELPLWLAAVLIVAVPTGLAMSGTVLLRRWIGHQHLAENNEIAGFKFATVGVIYAVLLAFAVVVVWEKFSLAESSVTEEAGAAATIYRLAAGPDADVTATRAALDAYVHAVIDKDFPAMARGAESKEAAQALTVLYARALEVAGHSEAHPAVAPAIFSQLDSITHARRARLQLAAGIVPPIIWATLFGGGVLTVCFTFFFGTRNLKAQVLMTGILSVLVFTGLLVIVSIDHPFTGPTHVDSEALEGVLADFGARP